MAKNTQNTPKPNKKELFLKALGSNLGHITDACKSDNIHRRSYYSWIEKDKDCLISNACAGAKVGRRTYYEWMDADPEFNQAVKDVEESLKDDTEGWLIDACKKGNVAAIIYRCKTKCRDRGYDEHQQIGIIQPIQDVELEGL